MPLGLTLGTPGVERVERDIGARVEVVPGPRGSPRKSCSRIERGSGHEHCRFISADHDCAGVSHRSPRSGVPESTALATTQAPSEAE